MIPADWFEHFPDVADEIQREGRRGNFISLLGRHGEDQLMRRFRQGRWIRGSLEFGFVS